MNNSNINIEFLISPSTTENRKEECKKFIELLKNIPDLSNQLEQITQHVSKIQTPGLERNVEIVDMIRIETLPITFKLTAIGNEKLDCQIIFKCSGLVELGKEGRSCHTQARVHYSIDVAKNKLSYPKDGIFFGSIIKF